MKNRPRERSACCKLVLLLLDEISLDHVTNCITGILGSFDVDRRYLSRLKIDVRERCSPPDVHKPIFGGIVEQICKAYIRTFEKTPELKPAPRPDK